MLTRKVLIRTVGCQMNDADLEVMERLREREGYRKIVDWSEEDRPREKLLKFGEDTLTTSELLAVLLKSSVKGVTNE